MIVASLPPPHHTRAVCCQPLQCVCAPQQRRANAFPSKSMSEWTLAQDLLHSDSFWTSIFASWQRTRELNTTSGNISRSYAITRPYHDPQYQLPVGAWRRCCCILGEEVVDAQCPTANKQDLKLSRLIFLITLSLSGSWGGCTTG